MKPLYIIDFSNFAYKFKSVYKFAAIEVKGVKVDTSVLFGFTKALKENPFNDICIVLDGIPSRSMKLLGSYKGQRMKDDEKLSLGVPKLEVIKYLTSIGTLLNKNVFVVCAPLQETDEVISSIVHIVVNTLPQRASFISKLNTKEISQDPMLRYLQDQHLQLKDYDFSQYTHCVIASTDGDFIQLQRFPNVTIDESTAGRRITADRTSKSTLELNPAATAAYKAIYGDVSDNIQPISINLKKDNVLKVLHRYVTNDETLHQFYLDCTKGTKSNRLLGVITQEIYTKYLPKFLINWEVAFLTFRSFPQMITYTDYDIQSTIDKYKLKVYRK